MKTTGTGKIGYRGSRQEGISLFVVLIILLLTMLVALWASRTALFSEMVTANDADYQRAFERAQALVVDAKFDIVRGACVPAAPSTALCRRKDYASPDKIYYPENEAEFFDMYYSDLQLETVSCRNGICLSFPGKDIGFFWQNSTSLGNMASVGASYGQFTGRTPGYLGSDPESFYWVEVLKFDKTREISGGARAINFGPTADRPFVFRITAVANGARSTTRAVVQTIFVWRTLDG